MLNEQGLCDIYTEAGPSMLCGTCRDYPRHREEYEGVVELSLSLSCAEAAGSYWNIRARCSREVEHSDRNLAYLERALIRDKVFHMDDLLGFLGGGKIF